MLQIEGIIQRLAANAEAIRSLLKDIPAEQAEWKPGPEIWSLKEVMHHVYNEERIDFRKHLKDMFNTPSKPWEAWSPEQMLPITSLQQGLESFLQEREASIIWLKQLKSPDWEIISQAPWGPISAGDVLVSWVEHDYLHLRQLIEVFHALSVRQAPPYSIQYAGDW